jgi:hypothetical protein
MEGALGNGSLFVPSNRAYERFPYVVLTLPVCPSDSLPCVNRSSRLELTF